MQIILASGKTIPVDPRLTLLANLKNGGVNIIAPCGGDGVCGRCKVIVKEGKYRTRLKEILSEKEILEGYTAACHTYLESDLKIEIPASSLLNVDGVIATGRAEDLENIFNSLDVCISPLTTKAYLELPVPTLADNISDMERLKRGLAEMGFRNPNFSFRLIRELARNLRQEDWHVTVTLMDTEYGKEVIRISPGKADKVMDDYGLAIDIGTTTVIVCLIYLATGRLVDIASTYNHQIIYGEDVISRIVYATEHGGLRDLKEAVIDDINSLIESLKGKYRLADRAIESIVIAGNTTMMQLFLGLDPASIRKEPYVTTTNRFPITGAGRIGLKVMPDIPVYTLPCVASYVGGDIVSGVLATKIHEKQELCAFIDVGTNGELVIGNAEWMVAAACSAGPCFEGGGLKNGMRATEGAIDSVKINPVTFEPEITVIGEGVPSGICGSGIIDTISEMFLKGIITPKGKFSTDLGLNHIHSTDAGPEFVLFQTGDDTISITESDIDNILRAKAAIYAGFMILLKEVGLTFNDISTFYIAGGFGRYLNIEKAITIGMFPDQPRDKFKYLGNTSVTGAYLCLLSENLRKQAENIADNLTTIELSVSGHFMDEYIAGLFLPHTNLSAFPTVAEARGIILESTV